VAAGRAQPDRRPAPRSPEFARRPQLTLRGHHTWVAGATTRGSVSAAPHSRRDDRRTEQRARMT
jgi:hypothetical protein